VKRELDETLEAGCLKPGDKRIAASGIIEFYFSHTALNGTRQREGHLSPLTFTDLPERTAWAFVAGRALAVQHTPILILLVSLVGIAPGISKMSHSLVQSATGVTAWPAAGQNECAVRIAPYYGFVQGV
jgi:hypothetical protein